MKSVVSSRGSAQRRVAWVAIPMAIAVSIVGLAIAHPSMAQSEPSRILTVNGQGTESIPATLTVVRLGVEVQARSATEAQEQAAQQSNAVVELLRSRNVQDLQTAGINLSPRYNYSGETQRLVGYTASNIVTFEIATDEVGDLLDQAVNAGATRIDNIRFTAEDDALDAARQDALQEATEDALSQADAVLAGLGFNRQDIVGIQVNGASPPIVPSMPMFDGRVESYAAQTPVIGGEQDVNATVTLQIRY